MLIDGQGRLFGRVNVVDAAVVLVICVLMPLMYGAYLLFRPELPGLIAIEPAQVVPGTQRVGVRGEHLRPNLRIVIGDFGARFLLADAENGVTELPTQLAPGVYDVALLDEDREVSRLPGGLTVASEIAPGREVLAVGNFDVSDLERAQALQRGLESAGQDPMRSWDVLEVLPPEPGTVRMVAGGVLLASGSYQVRSVLRFRCVFNQGTCSVLGVALDVGAVLALPVSVMDAESANLRITDLHPAYTRVVDVTLRASAPRAEELELAALREEVGRDTGGEFGLTVQPSIESLDVIEEKDFGELVVVARVRVPVIETDRGLVHRTFDMRTGEGFFVNGRTFRFFGRIVTVESNAAN